VARDAAQLIVAGGEEAKQAIRDLTRWLKDAQVVAICDPYIFHFEPPKKKLREPIFRSEDDYVDFIAGLVPATARHVKLYGAGYTKKIKSALKRKLKEGRTLDIFDTFHIHDRYVIKNAQAGPVPFEQLRNFLLSPSGGKHALVWCKGLQDWKAAGEMPELVAISKGRRPSRAGLRRRPRWSQMPSPWRNRYHV
jgi:GYF domain 2